MKNKKSVRLPRGWTAAEVDDLRSHYENQTQDEAVAEDEAAARSQNEIDVPVPRKLLPQVRKLIAEYKGKTRFRSRKPRRVA
jgi:hypothetical protein